MSTRAWCNSTRRSEAVGSDYPMRIGVNSCYFRKEAGFTHGLLVFDLAQFADAD